MIGILRTNGMKMEPHGDRGIPGVVIYPIYCLINHACYNNTNYVKFPDLHLELRSQLAIRKGEQIFTRYVSSTIGRCLKEYIPINLLIQTEDKASITKLSINLKREMYSQALKNFISHMVIT
jgi:hypothetical protein